MQCLEVSGAVRPTYGSLGVKRLIVMQRFLQLNTLQRMIWQHIYHKLTTYLSSYYILSKVVKKCSIRLIMYP